jgi:Domain of unknown function (DUF4365)
MLTEQNIESELSYAYLHAVATRGGFSCAYGNRHEDGAGIDATVREDGRKLAADSPLTSFCVEVQLKATRQVLVEQNGVMSFSLEIPQYNKLRNTRRAAPLILVLLRLPSDPTHWITHSSESLIARRCAYWVSLCGAPESPNTTSQTVYLPTNNVLSVEALTALMTRVSRREELRYGR